MDTVESVATAKQTLFKMVRPSKTMWLVAHNGSDIAHVIELPKGCECLTGMPNLEDRGSQQAAEARAKQFGWVEPEEPGQVMLDLPDGDLGVEYSGQTKKDPRGFPAPGAINQNFKF